MAAPNVNIVVFTSSGTYNPTPGTTGFKFTVTGGGGGAAGVVGGGGTGAAVATCGGAGGTCILSTDNVESGINIVVGAGGAGGIGSGLGFGSPGALSSVTGTVISMQSNGGLGGFGDVDSTGDNFTEGRSGGAASGGDVNIDGGSCGGVSRANGSICQFSNSSQSFWGSGGLSNNLGDGTDGVAHGSGGGGAAVESSSTDYDGGDGADGIVVIEEYS